MGNKNNKNQISAELGYNLCPRCGSPAYGITTDDDIHHVGCIYCGFANGVENYIGDCDEEQIREVLRKEWNKRCLNSEFSEEFFEAWDVFRKCYVIPQSTDDYIVYITTKYSEVVDFAMQHQDDPYDLYVVINGALCRLGTTALVWLTLTNKTN